MSEQQREEEFKRLREEQLDRLEQHVRGEAKDAAWSRQTEALIGRLFSSVDLPGTSLRSANCASTACIVQLDHQTRDAQSQLANVILDKEPFQSAHANRFRYQKQGHLTTVVYLLRSSPKQ
jgi:hypothetical protein